MCYFSRSEVSGDEFVLQLEKEFDDNAGDDARSGGSLARWK